MNEGEYRSRFREFLSGYSDRVVRNLEKLEIPNCEYLNFQINPEYFQDELAVQVDRVVETSDFVEKEVLLDSLYKEEDYVFPSDLDPQDFESDPENRFELVTAVVSEWLEGLWRRVDLGVETRWSEPG